MGDTLPEITKALQGIYRYSQRKTNIPRKLYDPSKPKEWEQFWLEKNNAMQAGNTQALKCDGILRSLQFTANDLSNEVIKIRNETEQNMINKQRELEELNRQYENQRWGWPWDDIANAFTGNETRLRAQIAATSDSVYGLARVADALASYASTSQQLITGTASLGVFWNDLTNDSNTITGIWEPLKDYPEDELEIAIKTWDALEDQIRAFKPDLF
ncbi:hypothetical protein AA313_de0202515 [Arthrobotrys entomopaga]|nr:hypothetical protein AA313_de0202515 [Arthrobotrys entomopaga]